MKVKFSILASIDNTRAVDTGNNGNVGGRTHHVVVNQNFLWEIKEAGIIEIQWISTASNKAAMFMKNLVRSEHNKHAARLHGHDKYYSIMQDTESHE